mmetsp:Transcript_15874/g.37495  ORF Transcript_15874/g.37495 Transcript_15874/m.37495 type:complete len:212 (+) Transcript_15874:675-1310(+)
MLSGAFPQSVAWAAPQPSARRWLWGSCRAASAPWPHAPAPRARAGPDPPPPSPCAVATQPAGRPPDAGLLAPLWLPSVLPPPPPSSGLPWPSSFALHGGALVTCGAPAPRPSAATPRRSRLCSGSPPVLSAPLAQPCRPAPRGRRAPHAGQLPPHPSEVCPAASSFQQASSLRLPWLRRPCGPPLLRNAVSLPSPAAPGLASLWPPGLSRP